MADVVTLESGLKTIVLWILATFTNISTNTYKAVDLNQADATYLQQNLGIYYEFPPIFHIDQTRWQDAWDDQKYPTPRPLLIPVSESYQQIFFDEALDYTWLCYAKLK